MKTIILPTDFSDNAKNAIQFAINMFDGGEARFISLNTFELHHHSPAMMINLDDVMKKDAEQSMEMELNYIRSQNKDKQLSITGVCRKGPLTDILDKVIKFEKADMVVMGTKGADSVENAIMGSNTAAVIRKTELPVLAVPEEARFTPVQKVVFAVDGEAIINTDCLQPLADVCKRSGASLLLLNVSEGGEEPVGLSNLKDQLQQVFAGIPHTWHVIKNDHISDGISAFVEQEKADLLAMLSREEGFFQRVFSRSETRKMAMHTQVPLLVLDEQQS